MGLRPGTAPKQQEGNLGMNQSLKTSQRAVNERPLSPYTKMFTPTQNAQRRKPNVKRGSTGGIQG